MLQLHGRATSVHTQKVMWLATELELKIERFDVGGPFGGNDDPRYLALNPNGTVPTLVDGKFVLWESNSILRYVAAKYGRHPWRRQSIEHTALASQWLDWSSNALLAPIRGLFSILLRTPPKERDMTAVRVARRQAIGLWSILDAQLARHRFVVDDEPTIGDIPLAILAYRWYGMPIEDRPKLKHLDRWYKALAKRPGFKKYVKIPLG